MSTLIRLLLQEQSDLGLHCLHMSFLSDTLVFEILGLFFFINMLFRAMILNVDFFSFQVQ